MNHLLLVISLMIGTFSPSLADKLELQAGRFSPKDSVREIKIVERAIAPLPVKNSSPLSPRTAQGYLVIDLDSLSEMEPLSRLDSRFQIASITKLMTAVVALENFDQGSILTVPSLNLLADESKMGLVTGERIRVRELIRGTLIPSGSDAARTLAASYDGGESAFIEAMNNKARELSMDNTRFANPVGLDDDNNYSTPRDLAVLARYALKNDIIRESVSLKVYTARSEDGRMLRLANTNQLLDGRTVLGVKTGRTSKAGECLITLSRVKGHDVITIILGSSNRFGETSSLLDSLKSSYVWEQ